MVDGGGQVLIMRKVFVVVRKVCVIVREGVKGNSDVPYFGVGIAVSV
jgi:hypothetical protein